MAAGVSASSFLSVRDTLLSGLVTKAPMLRASANEWWRLGGAQPSFAAFVQPQLVERASFLVVRLGEERADPADRL